MLVFERATGYSGRKGSGDGLLSELWCRVASGFELLWPVWSGRISPRTATHLVGCTPAPAPSISIPTTTAATISIYTDATAARAFGWAKQAPLQPSNGLSSLPNEGHDQDKVGEAEERYKRGQGHRRAANRRCDAACGGFVP